MAQRYGPFYDNVAQVTGNSGWYGIYNSTHKVYVPVYIDQDYDGGGWVCVLANRKFTSGMNNCTFDQAVNECNYRTEPSGNDTTNTPALLSNLKNLGLDDVNVWVGLKFWSMFGGRKTSNKIEVAMFAAATNGTALNATSSHSERYTFRFDDFSSSNNYSWSNASNGSIAAGSLTPGLYSYTNRPLTTYDADNDTNSGNCSTYYNNNPWWYGSCWSGNMFAGGGYSDGPYWTSSSSTYLRQYMAVYIK